MKNSVEIIKDIRARLGLSQHMLGNILGVSRDIVASWENNRSRVPGDMLLKAQKFFEKSTRDRGDKGQVAGRELIIIN